MSIELIVRTPDGMVKFQDIDVFYCEHGALVIVGEKGKTLLAPGAWLAAGADTPEPPRN